VTAPRVVAVAPGSPAARAGVAVGDELVLVNGEPPRDLIRFRVLTDEPSVSLDVDRGGLVRNIEVEKAAGEPLGVEVHSALFDALQTCDNHCGFCFIHQLPPGLRRSLYKRDDDYRLSFLYGNFTTLTRFTEADLERVVAEGLSPLNVSIHATDPEVRAAMLRNRRGATSLRWLRALLDHGVEVHGQVVVCPGINDGAVLDDTLIGVLDRYPELASLAVVPLGVSRHNPDPTMRPHTPAEAAAVVDAVEGWQELFRTILGRRLVFAADEYYLLAGRSFPPADAYEGFRMHEDGIGMARTFELEYEGRANEVTGVRAGFFAWADSEGTYEPYRGMRQSRSERRDAAPGAPRPASEVSAAGGGSSCGADRGVRTERVSLRPRRDAPVAILTGTYGASVLAPLVGDRARVIAVENRFFGGNVGVAGLLVGEDLARVLADELAGHRYLLPDVCLSQGRFLDGTTPEDLPRPVEVVPTDGVSLRKALA
jgi:putative radical SAM enzyme (TIGR03279 family)